MENSIMVPAFSVNEVSDVIFGGFAVDRFMCSRPNKLPWRDVTLPQAMIVAADKGKGSHLLTAFEWASMAYRWKEAKSLDDCPVDLHAETWQWVMGLFMDQDGHLDILASLSVSAASSPYGRGTFKTGSGFNLPEIICDGEGSNWQKTWQPGEFDGTKIYIAEAEDGAGAFFPVEGTGVDRILLPPEADPGSDTATFCIVRHVEQDVTAHVNNESMISGNKITSLRDSDPNLKAFAIPATSNERGRADLGYDRFWFYKSSTVRAAIRGGNFNSGADAGVFALDLYNAPSNSDYDVGFRAGKAL